MWCPKLKLNNSSGVNCHFCNWIFNILKSNSPCEHPVCGDTPGVKFCSGWQGVGQRSSSTSLSSVTTSAILYAVWKHPLTFQGGKGEYWERKNHKRMHGFYKNGQRLLHRLLPQQKWTAQPKTPGLISKHCSCVYLIQKWKKDEKPGECMGWSVGLWHRGWWFHSPQSHKTHRATMGQFHFLALFQHKQPHILVHLFRI